jgi:5-(carboxyamino)imidazole ribonucleotide mutase
LDAALIWIHRKNGSSKDIKKTLFSFVEPNYLSQKISEMVGIIMGSKSDWPIMQDAAEVLKALGVAYEAQVVSAHRTPERMFEYAQKAHSRGIKVIIAGAGGAAHLPGMTASITPLPVIGVPIKSSNSIDGWDSILSILQMPSGVPVATVALNGGRNAGILAAQIMGSHDESLLKRLVAFKEELKKKVLDSANDLI